MFVLQAPNGDTVLNAAQRLQKPVEVVRMPTTVPAREGAVVVMRPAMLIAYSVYDSEQDLSYTFSEVVAADQSGYVDLSHTFFQRLVTDNQRYALVARSGSI